MLMSTNARVTMRNTEKKVLKYYDDGGKGKGNCTWGIGTLAHRGPCTAEELARVVTDEDVEREFAARLRVAERGVTSKITVTLTQEQFDALVSYTFNRGPSGAYKAFELINDGKFANAASEISSHVTASVREKKKSVAKVLPGLIVRRREESAPFRSDVKSHLEQSK